jgi:hypothetical protein
VHNVSLYSCRSLCVAQRLQPHRQQRCGPQLGKVSQAKQQRSKHRSRTKLIPAKRCIARCKSRSTLAGNLPDEPKDAILASRGARFNSASLVGGPSSSIAASASCCSSLQLHAFHMQAFEQCVQASKDTSRTMGRHTAQVQTKLCCAARAPLPTFSMSMDASGPIGCVSKVPPGIPNLCTSVALNRSACTRWLDACEQILIFYARQVGGFQLNGALRAKTGCS